MHLFCLFVSVKQNLENYLVIILNTTMGTCQNNPKTLQQLDAQDSQSHLVKHWKNLPTNDKRRTFEQEINRVNVTGVMKIYRKSSRSSNNIKDSNDLGSSTASDRASGINEYRPLASQTVITKESVLKQKKELDEIGLEAIRNGEVAVFLMSGSQNSRMNIDVPLGIYDIGLYSACTIFEILICKLKNLCVICGCTDNKKIKLYIMTNTDNKNSIKDYFKAKNYFDYGSNNIFFFSQPVEPTVDEQGKIVLRNESSIYMSPRGNGMIYSEIKQKNLIDHLTKQGVKQVYFGPINNLLLKIADPCSLGYLIRERQQVVAMCVESKDDCLGFFGQTSNKRFKVYEDKVHNPAKKWANLGSCWMSIQFLMRVVNDAQFLAHLQEQYHDILKQTIVYSPTFNSKVTQKCLFFESFYHEAFSLADRLSILEVNRESQFAPIKSAGQDKYSLSSAREAFWNWNRSMVASEGIQFASEGILEIHPKLIYDGQNIGQIIKQKGIQKQLKLPYLIS